METTSTKENENTAEKAREALKEFESSRNIKHGNQEESVFPSGFVKSEKQEDFSEVSQALLELESKQKEESFLKHSKEEFPKSSKMVKFLIKNFGVIIKNEQQANYVLLGIAVLVFIVSGILFFVSGR